MVATMVLGLLAACRSPQKSHEDVPREVENSSDECTYDKEQPHVIFTVKAFFVLRCSEHPWQKEYEGCKGTYFHGFEQRKTFAHKCPHSFRHATFRRMHDRETTSNGQEEKM